MLALLNQEREKTATELQDRDTENQKLQKAIWQGYAQFFLSILLNFFPEKNLVPEPYLQEKIRYL